MLISGLEQAGLSVLIQRNFKTSVKITQYTKVLLGYFFIKYSVQRYLLRRGESVTLRAIAGLLGVGVEYVRPLVKSVQY